jgi:LPS-assembly lipoprotein
MWFYKCFISLSLCFLLTACGFRPLYTPHMGRSDIAYPIKIATISDRNGQTLRNYLVDLLTPEGTPTHPQYILEINLTDAIRSIGVKKNETTSRSEALLTANLTLKDAKTNAVVYKHTAKAINTFSIINQNYYADLVAEEYAKKEATRLLAEKIMLLLTTYIDTHE